MHHPCPTCGERVTVQPARSAAARRSFVLSCPGSGVRRFSQNAGEQRIVLAYRHHMRPGSW